MRKEKRLKKKVQAEDWISTSYMWLLQAILEWPSGFSLKYVVI